MDTDFVCHFSLVRLESKCASKCFFTFLDAVMANTINDLVCNRDVDESSTLAPVRYPGSHAVRLSHFTYFLGFMTAGTIIAECKDIFKLS